MNDAKQKVVDEKAQLQDKIMKLSNFMVWDKNFENLSKEQRWLLKLQQRVMLVYNEILEARLNIWEE